MSARRLATKRAGVDLDAPAAMRLGGPTLPPNVEASLRALARALARIAVDEEIAAQDRLGPTAPTH